MQNTTNKKVHLQQIRKIQTATKRTSTIQTQAPTSSRNFRRMEKGVANSCKNRISSFYMETDSGRYSLDTINASLQLYKAKTMRKFVKEEIDWFSETYKSPYHIEKLPKKASLKAGFHTTAFCAQS